MGRYVRNLEMVCDHATPEKYSAVRLHLDLPIDRDQFSKIQDLLEKDKWSEVSSLLAREYPQYESMLADWLDACKARIHDQARVASLV